MKRAQQAFGTMAAAMMLAFGSGQAAQADPSPVVVELFTSQGCSSCPPADALLADLAQREGVLPLALHVDYWDYIGWEDSFGDPRNTYRQKAYAHAAGNRTIYTPQMIVGGTDHVVGYEPMELAERITLQSRQPQRAEIDLGHDGAQVTVDARILQPARGPVVLVMMTFAPSKTVEIRRGENEGKTITYVNIVTHWEVLAEGDGASALTAQVAAPVDENAAFLVQEKGPGAILAAAVLK